MSFSPPADLTNESRSHGTGETGPASFPKLSDPRNAHLDSWRSRDPKRNVIWPREWLPSVFGRARVLTVSYCSAAATKRGRVGMESVIEILVEHLLGTPEVPIGQDCPVILVGHSLGGLVIKEIVLHSKRKLAQYTAADSERGDGRRLSSFLENIRGVFYFGTPHHVLRLPNDQNMDQLMGLLAHTSEVWDFLRGLNDEKARLNDEFKTWRQDQNVKVGTVIESLPTTLPLSKVLWLSMLHWLSILKSITTKLPFPKSGFSAILVEDVSARLDSDELWRADNDDHFSICHPKDEQSMCYKELINFTRNCVDGHIRIGKPKFDPMVETTTQKPPYTYEWISPHVFQLYCSPEEPEFDIVFFHGLQLAYDATTYWKAWLTRAEAVVWPEAWLSEDLDRIRVLSICYHPGELNAIFDLVRFSELLLWELISKGVGQNRGLILVGHSLGGRIIKEVVVRAFTMTTKMPPAEVKGSSEGRKMKSFLENIKGIFYFSTPHLKTRGLTNLMKVLPSMLVFEYCLADLKSSRQNHDFESLLRNQRVLTATVGEGRPTTVPYRHRFFKKTAFRGMVVDEFSARCEGFFSVWWMPITGTYADQRRSRPLNIKYFFISSSRSAE